jgi:hypothetical protein
MQIINGRRQLVFLGLAYGISCCCRLISNHCAVSLHVSQGSYKVIWKVSINQEMFGWSAQHFRVFPAVLPNPGSPICSNPAGIGRAAGGMIIPRNARSIEQRMLLIHIHPVILPPRCATCQTCQIGTDRTGRPQLPTVDTGLS